jgi:hypothetical protein
MYPHTDVRILSINPILFYHLFLIFLFQISSCDINVNKI